jgi:hypothetical protein
VNEPNTSFAAGPDSGFNPVGRWRESFSEQELAQLDEMIGDTLQEFGYELAKPLNSSAGNLRKLRDTYRRYFNLKLWLKSRTPAGRFLVTKDLSWL